jgi:hypothetical protein
MSWGAQNRSEDAKTPGVAGVRSEKPELDRCPIQPYVQVMRFVDLKEYNYILTSAAVKFGDFHALMQALQGVESSDPDSHLEVKKKRRQSVEVRTAGKQNGSQG